MTEAEVRLRITALRVVLDAGVTIVIFEVAIAIQCVQMVDRSFNQVLQQGAWKRRNERKSDGDSAEALSMLCSPIMPPSRKAIGRSESLADPPPLRCCRRDLAAPQAAREGFPVRRGAAPR